MIKNLLSNLPGLSNLGKGGDDLTPEELAAKEREDRIGFHRSKVRNGPVKFSIPTNGQIRRMKVRESKTHQRKQLEQARRQHWHGRQECATLRAYLQGAGILPYATGYAPSEETITRAYTWIVSRFGEVPAMQESTISPKLVEDAIQAAWKRYTELMGLPYEPLKAA